MIAVTLLILGLAGGLLLLAAIVMMDQRGSKNKGYKGPKKKTNVVYVERFDPALVRQRWDEVNASMHTPSGLRQALVEADKLLDYVLKAKGYHGETMADRMKKAQSQFRNREAVWAAHKLRNMHVHEVQHDLVPGQVQKAVHDLGQAIIDLGVKLHD